MRPHDKTEKATKHPDADEKHGGGTKKKPWLRHHRRHEGELDGGEAFLHDNRYGFNQIEEGDVEAFGEEFIAGATSNEAIGEVARDEAYAEELGGFIIETYEEDDDADDAGDADDLSNADVIH